VARAQAAENTAIITAPDSLSSLSSSPHTATLCLAPAPPLSRLLRRRPPLFVSAPRPAAHRRSRQSTAGGRGRPPARARARHQRAPPLARPIHSARPPQLACRPTPAPARAAATAPQAHRALSVPAVRRRQCRSPSPPSSAAAGAKLYSSHHSAAVAKLVA
jgi:hypothetical protein